MIKFCKIDDDQIVIKYLAMKIGDSLKNGKVLWLIPGGSAIKIATAVANHLSDSTNISNLSISLTDERYGEVGHSDSNWQQLKDNGFDLPYATLIPVLIGKSLEETAANYQRSLQEHLSDNSFSIALTGLGPDGHILGIKPGSPSVNEPELVSAYKWDDYTRLTITNSLLKQVSEVVVYAVGEPKHQQLDRIEDDIAPADQPAQFLKQLDNVLIFNDYKGDSK